MNIELERIYDTSDTNNEFRVLVDRLWPRGISKEQANLNYWAKSIAPSNELRKWYHQDLSRWDEFKCKYLKELNSLSVEHFDFLNNVAPSEKIILLFGSKNKLQNHAVVLKEFILTKGLV